jgi:hypothetical protein
MAGDDLQRLTALAHHTGRPTPSGIEIERRAASCRTCCHGYQAVDQPCDYFPAGDLGSRQWAVQVLFSTCLVWLRKDG